MPVTDSVLVIFSTMIVDAAVMGIDVQAIVLYMSLVICHTVTACTLAWPVDMHFGGINEHVHTTRCPCIDAFMLHGL